MRQKTETGAMTRMTGPYSAADISPLDPMKEIEFLQEIIARHENQAFTVVALLSTALGGLAALVFSSNINLGPWSVGFIGSLSAILFWAWALNHYALCSAAVERVSVIELQIRCGLPYDGPRISQSLQRLGIKHWVGGLLYWKNSVPFIVGIVASAAIAGFSTRIRSEPEKPPRQQHAQEYFNDSINDLFF